MGVDAADEREIGPRRMIRWNEDCEGAEGVQMGAHRRAVSLFSGIKRPEFRGRYNGNTLGFASAVGVVQGEEGVQVPLVLSAREHCLHSFVTRQFPRRFCTPSLIPPVQKGGYH